MNIFLPEIFPGHIEANHSPIFIILVVICCIVASISQSNDENEKRQSILLAEKFAARMPDAFIRIFGEEFPEHASEITYSKAKGCIDAWNSTVTSKEYKKHISWIGNKYKSPTHQRAGELLLARNVASQVSDKFLEQALADPDKFSETFQRAIKAAATLSKSDV